MNKRERTLLIGLVTVGGLGVTYTLVYPKVIRPLFDVSTDIADAKAKQAELEEELLRFDVDTVRYKDYVQRTGGTDANRVKDEFYARLNDLIKQTNLEKGRVSPRPPSVDRSSLQKLNFSINAEGTWDDVVQFIRRFYELPHVAQFTDLKLSPAGTRRTARDRVKISGTIEVLVLPKIRDVGNIDGQSGTDEGERIKYVLADASPLTRQPFLEYQEPRPPRPKPQLTVAEGPEEPETPPGPNVELDPDRTQKVIPVIWDSVGVRNLRQKDETQWLDLGDRLDGGEIVLVHPLGVVVRRPDGEFVYPLGRRLSAAIKLEDATAFPEIQVAMGVYVEEEDEEPAEQDADLEPASAAGWDDWRRLLRPRGRMLGGSVDDADLCGPPYQALTFDPGMSEPEPEPVPEPEEPPTDTEVASAEADVRADAETEPEAGSNGSLYDAEPGAADDAAEPVVEEEEGVEAEPSDLAAGTAEEDDVDTNGSLDDADEEYEREGNAEVGEVNADAATDEIDVEAGTAEVEPAEAPQP